MSSGDRIPAAALAILTTLLVGIAPAPALAQASPDAPPSSAEPGAAAPPAEALPDPATDRQKPAPVSESPRPYPGPPRSEVGVDVGMIARPSSGNALVHYPTGWGAGGHVRVEILDWLGFRLATRFERAKVTFDEGALELPPGTVYNQPELKGVNIGVSLEPQWRPVPRLLLFAGLGSSWGRTIAESLHTTGAEQVVLPSRSYVFIEFPLSLGARFELIPQVLVMTLRGSASLLTDQSGRAQKPYDTPNQGGQVIEVGPFPQVGPSFSLLTGMGVLL
jgi:hypothetical protein